jgi:hypothetical protein
MINATLPVENTFGIIALPWNGRYEKQPYIYEYIQITQEMKWVRNTGKYSLIGSVVI